MEKTIHQDCKLYNTGEETATGKQKLFYKPVK